MTGPEVLNAPEPSGSGGPRSVAVRVRRLDGWWVYDNRQTMKEKVKQFVGAKRGVSPVIGVMNATRYSNDYIEVS